MTSYDNDNFYSYDDHDDYFWSNWNDDFDWNDEDWWADDDWW